MFEQRLKILIGLLALFAALILGRALQLQVIQADEWQERAEKAMAREQFYDTVRGRVLDRNGLVLACDEPCMNALVDYRAIALDPAWIRELALNRLLARPDRAYSRADRTTRRKLLQDETERVVGDIGAMWKTLATETGHSIEEIEETKAAIRQRVEMLRRSRWSGRYRTAVTDKPDEPEPWLARWLLSGEDGPDIDSFFIEVAEQTEPHIVVPNIRPEVHNRLKKQIERLPGLQILPGKHRVYPFGRTACHILGNLGIVQESDLKNDPNRDDPLRCYRARDLIGRTGVEALCDQALRGVRGRVERLAGSGAIVEEIRPVAGRDVRLTLDVELQAQIEAAFAEVRWEHEDGMIERHEMHGAAVVIDLAGNDVLALVSYPTFDPNTFDDDYPRLVADRKNQPLLNRATQMALEPGSTVKPIVGLSAITDGILPPDATIECTGFLCINGHYMKHGKCWVATKYLASRGKEGVRHHPIPYDDPHPTGHLTFSDALQRSCNVFFETLGDRMHVTGLSRAFRNFGLGQKTGIGLPESPGRIPDQYRDDPWTRQSASWFSAIGQHRVMATPIQMANVAATIARDGVWMRPGLLASKSDANPTTRPAAPDVRDLHLHPAAIAAAREGMTRVVNTRGGTANRYMHRDDVLLAGKTGTAQVTSRFFVVYTDEKGNARRNPITGKFEGYWPAISTHRHPNPDVPWYRGTGKDGNELSHAWFIGFAPADKPRIAFCVMLEYGGSGGSDTAPIVQKILDACIQRGYLPAAPARTRLAVSR